jgi:FtsH-binding integral membrane protein
MKLLLAILLLATAATASAQTNRFAATVFNALTNNLSITNQTNATTISNLTFATQANARYAVTFYPIIEAASTSTVLQVVASNATVYGFWNGITTGFAGTNEITNGNAYSITTARGVLQTFFVQAGTNAGNVTVTFYSSVATNTNTIKAGSFMRADRVPQ